MDPDTTSFRPPYMSFQTFWQFIDELGSKPVPPQIDRSLMSSKSGTDQLNLTATLTAFGLVGASGVVNGPLRAMAEADQDERRAMLAALVRQYYPDAIRVSEAGGTEQQLNEAFREAFGMTAVETRRKAVTFFLHAAREAQIPLSAYFPATRGGSGSPGAPKPKRSSAAKRAKSNGTGSAAVPIVTSEQTAGGERKHVSFGDAGEVTVTVSVKWLDLPDEVFTGLRRVIRDLEALGEPTDSRAQSAPGPATDTGA
jgi:hypothetical protein